MHLFKLSKKRTWNWSFSPHLVENCHQIAYSGPWIVDLFLPMMRSIVFQSLRACGSIRVSNRCYRNSWFRFLFDSIYTKKIEMKSLFNYEIMKIYVYLILSYWNSIFVVVVVAGAVDEHRCYKRTVRRSKRVCYIFWQIERRMTICFL